MRLSVLDHGQPLRTKLLFAFIGLVSRQPVPDAVKLISYRPEFYGTPMKAVAHEAMRGPSPWSVGDRELMAAVVSNTNRCDFCTKAHSAIAARAYQDEAPVSAALSDLERAPLAEPQYRAAASTVRWRYQEFSEPYLRLPGPSPLEGTAEAVVRGGRITVLTLVLSPESLKRRRGEATSILNRFNQPRPTASPAWGGPAAAEPTTLAWPLTLGGLALLTALAAVLRRRRPS